MDLFVDPEQVDFHVGRFNLAAERTSFVEEANIATVTGKDETIDAKTKFDRQLKKAKHLLDDLLAREWQLG